MKNHSAEGAQNRKLLPREEDFKGRPGYRRRKAKVWRTGVGYVDGYKWSYQFKANNGRGKLTKQAEEVGRMLTPFSRAEERRHAKAIRAPEHIPVAKQAEPRKDGRASFGWSSAYEAGYSRIKRRSA